MIEQIPDLENRCITCKRRAYTKLCDFVIGSFKTSIDFQERTLTCGANGNADQLQQAERDMESINQKTKEVLNSFE